MSNIRILSEHLANQIAAGEVIERPASVVKELLENSIDAAPDRVSVRVEGNGTRLIRIMDNGHGMDADDVLLSIERHATSKLRDEKELLNISTLGFRGEALPSIGSVSRLTILSRPAGADTGTKADIRFGTLHAIHEQGCSRGTIIEVRNLFGNVPARRKFLKSARTELFHIEEVVRNLSLAYPRIAFQLEIEQRLVIDVAAGDEPQKRVRDIFRVPPGDALLEISHVAEDGSGLNLRGFLLAPENLSTAKTNALRILVNKRPVRDNMIRHAVSEAMQGFLPKGRQPAGVMLLEIAPDQVDVNVHPAKQEVRFHRQQELRAMIIRAVNQALRSYQDEVRNEIFQSKPQTEVAEPEPPPLELAEPKPPIDDAPTPASKPLPGPRAPKTPVGVPADSPPLPPKRAATTAAPLPKPPARKRPLDNNVPPAHEQKNISAPTAATSHTEPESLAGLTLIGQLFQLYLLCEKDGRLIVIDQHAAHERILYQNLRDKYLQRDIPSQALLFPASMELAPQEADILEKHSEQVAALGIRAEHFGDTTWIIKSVPAMVAHLHPTDILREIISTLDAGAQKQPSGLIPKSIDDLLASLACKAAVKAGNRLAPKEMIDLLCQMRQTDYFSHCPHGRPVVKFISKREIEKWFQRT